MYSCLLVAQKCSLVWHSRLSSPAAFPAPVRKGFCRERRKANERAEKRSNPTWGALHAASEMIASDKMTLFPRTVAGQSWFYLYQSFIVGKATRAEAEFQGLYSQRSGYLGGRDMLRLCIARRRLVNAIVQTAGMAQRHFFYFIS